MLSKKVSRRKFILASAAGVAGAALSNFIHPEAALAAAPAAAPAAAADQEQASTAWSFGVISDTQWTIGYDDGYNPNTCAANIIRLCNQEFIKAGVKLVVAVGDTVDTGSATDIDTRALYAQALYDAGIAFYPLRGNHEAAETPPDLTSGPEMLHAFPQMADLNNNNTPADVTAALLPVADQVNNPPAVKTGAPFTFGANYSAPTAVNTANNSVSYAFRYNNATFMLLDQFDVTGNYYNSLVPAEQSWISATLSGRPANTHGFVFSHKNLLGGNHKDNLFGGAINSSDPGDGNGVDKSTLSSSDAAALTAKQAAMYAFIASLQNNNVRYMICGHDHHHYLSMVTAKDPASSAPDVKVHQYILQSDSSKFYTPGTPVSANDAPIDQDLYRVGYYIFTVNGPRVTMDYYGDTTGNLYYGLYGQAFNFVKIASYQFSLNGKGNLVAQGGSYAMTDDTTLAESLETGFKHTSMAILSGKNASIQVTNYNKKESNDVNTGWKASDSTLASDILVLSGMSRLPGTITDTYVLSMSYIGSDEQAALGNFAILAQDAQGRWMNAVKMNFSGAPNFVLGPWDSSKGYTLGAYGVDKATKTAWAILNYNGAFAVGGRNPIYMPAMFASH